MMSEPLTWQPKLIIRPLLRMVLLPVQYDDVVECN